MKYSAARPTALPGNLLLRAMAIAAVIGLGVGIYVGTAYFL